MWFSDSKEDFLKRPQIPRLYWATVANGKWTNPEQGRGLEGLKYPVCSEEGGSASKVFDFHIRTMPAGRLIWAM